MKDFTRLPFQFMIDSIVYESEIEENIDLNINDYYNVIYRFSQEELTLFHKRLDNCLLFCNLYKVWSYEMFRIKYFKDSLALYVIKDYDLSLSFSCVKFFKLIKNIELIK